VGADNQSVTIRQLMQKGVDVLERNYGDDPRFVIGMLVNISGRYMDLGDTNGEYAALVKAEALARRLADPERIAFVQCNTVETELSLGRLQRARERMRDGLANLAKLGNPSYDRKTDCGLAQARLLWSEGRLPEAIDAATAVAAIIERAGKADEDITYQSVTAMLQIMLSAEGRHREALEWSRRAIGALEHSGADATMQMSNARHSRAKELYDVGEVRAAFDMQTAVVARLAAQQGEEGLRAPHASRLGLYQVRIEETDAGLAGLDRAVALAVARNNRIEQIGTRLNRAQAFVLLGRLDAAAADIETVERLASDNPGENRDPLRAARLIRAEIHLARGQAEAAVGELDAILAEVGYPRTRVANRLATVLTTRARAELRLGRGAAALATAREAAAIAEASALNPERSAHVGAALMMMAEAQRATGDLVNARASAQRAAMALAASLGANHSETRAALQFE
jgi:tetratricopeptide (TPR) repeat protein